MMTRLLWTASIAFMIGSATAEPTDSSDENLAASLPRVAPRSPTEALRTFQSRHNFEMQLVASEPFVTDPVDAAFDERGRLWVVEMRGYPFPRPDDGAIGQVRVLTDSDDDGVYDESVTLADGLNWPTGIALWDQGCYVVAAPNIWYLKDTTGDGKADVREIAFTGFGNSNVQALANNLKWGVDGWIYGAAASNGGDITRPDDPGMRPVSVRGRDFRFHPKTRAFEAISGTAQFGQSFDNWYERFVCSNSEHAIHVVMNDKYLDLLGAVNVPSPLSMIAREGGAAEVFRSSPAEPWRTLRTARRAESGRPFAETELHAIGYFTSASGITIYRGDAYPAPFHGNLFVGDVGGNLIHRKTIEHSSASFVATRADVDGEFVTSTDNWFRPVNFVNAPDGTLHILDMYRETIEHPWSIPEDIKAHLDLQSGQDRGRVYRLAPPSFKRRPTPRLDQMTCRQLVQEFAQPNSWNRETAQRLLIERREADTVPIIKEHWNDWRADQPVAALHALGTLAALDQLSDETLVDAISAAEPKLVERAVRFAEPRLAESEVLRDACIKLLDHDDFRVGWQVLLSLGESGCSVPVDAWLRRAQQQGNDRWMRTALLASVGPTLDQVIEQYAHHPVDLPEAVLRDLGQRLPAANGSAVVSNLQLLTQNNRVRESTWLLSGLAAGLMSTGKTESFKSDLSKDDRAQWNALLDRAQQSAMDKSEPIGERLDAVRTLSVRGEWPEDHVRALLAADEPSSIQQALLIALAGSKATSTSQAVADAWSTAAPTVRSEIVEFLLTRRERASVLAQAVLDGKIAESQVPMSARQRLLETIDPSLRQSLTDRWQSLAADRQVVIERYLPELSSAGNAEAGAVVFKRECAGCHRGGSLGHDVGPNLTTVTSRTPDQLLRQILDPNIEILPAYIEYNVLLNDGRSLRGILAAETAQTITLRRAEGVHETVPRSEIDEMQSSGKSLMPEGLEQKITPREMADLIAFVHSLGDTSKITGSSR